MALDASALKALMIAKLAAAAATGALSTMDGVMGAISEAVVEHMKSNGEVDPGIAPDGLAAPPGGGPVTGFGKIK